MTLQMPVHVNVQIDGNQSPYLICHSIYKSYYTFTNLSVTFPCPLPMHCAYVVLLNSKNPSNWLLNGYVSTTDSIKFICIWFVYLDRILCALTSGIIAMNGTTIGLSLSLSPFVCHSSIYESNRRWWKEKLYHKIVVERDTELSIASI